MTASIRQADLSDPVDAQAIVELTDAYARDPKGGGRPLDDEVKAALVPAMREHGGIRVLLAEVDDESVGLATLIESFSAFNAAPVLNVHDLAVVEDHRGQGIGGRLLEATEAMAREMGCTRVTLEVLPDNPARKLYERQGFLKKSDVMVKSLGEDRIA